MRLLLLSFLLITFTSAVHAGKSYDLKIELRFIETDERLSGYDVSIVDEKGNSFQDKSNEFGVVFFQGLTEHNYTINVKSVNPLIKDYSSFFYSSKGKIQVQNIYLYPTALFEQTLLEKEDSLYGKFEESIDFPMNKHTQNKCDSINFKEPLFKDNIQGLQSFIVKEVRYPQISIENNEQGRVYLSFIIEKNGAISHVKIDRGASQALDYEAKRVVRAMPNWTPGTCNGEPSRVVVRLPISFSLN
jgi:TonB family protein